MNTPWWHELNFMEVARFYIHYVGKARTATQEKQLKRYLVQNDLWYLLVYICDLKFMISPEHNTQWLYERCREVEANPDDCLDLWAREHYKSTIITFGKTLQDILIDPEQTFGIFSYSKENAAKFTKQIKEQLESNQELKYLFDDVLYDKPQSQAAEWTDSSFIVKRRGRPKEPTVMACGLLKGMPTGMHFGKRIYDDIITEDMVGTPDMIKKITDRFRNSTNLGRLGGTQRLIGTRYHLFDSYRQIMKDGIVETRTHAATSDGSDDVTKSVFMPIAALRKKRREQGPYIFGCQMLQDPKADNQMGFAEEWLQYWDAENLANMNFMILVDPSSGRHNKTDYTSMWVVGKGGDENYYVCDIIRARLNLTGRCDVLFTLHRRYRKHGEVRVGYEQIGMQADIEHFKYVMDQQNYRFKITELGGIASKEARINRLHPIFEQNRIFLPRRCLKKITEGGQVQTVDMVQTFLEEEYLSYPVLDHDDMLDSLSRIEDEDMKKLSAPEIREPAWNAIKEIENRQMQYEPVV
jgi:phage terminase large subunit-like protein